ncbi:MAG: sugar transferase, partial [Myxococcales bacterium]|nr:sugar transferase [Myxococcales bacterium]
MADVGLASAGLVVTSPVLAGAALGVRATMGRPVLFVQERVGEGGRTFRILKLRTMAAGPGTDEERLTRLGRLLRSTSIDELPQLVNVLR